MTRSDAREAGIGATSEMAGREGLGLARCPSRHRQVQRSLEKRQFGQLFALIRCIDARLVRCLGTTRQDQDLGSAAAIKGVPMNRDEIDCPDCGVNVGERHVSGCDVALCRIHGEQWSFCFRDGSHGATIWSGSYPGSEEAEERSWFARRSEDGSWVRCASGDVGAIPDINRVRSELSWDGETERFS
jgi:hypothetical protein